MHVKGIPMTVVEKRRDAGSQKDKLDGQADNGLPPCLATERDDRVDDESSQEDQLQKLNFRPCVFSAGHGDECLAPRETKRRGINHRSTRGELAVTGLNGNVRKDGTSRASEQPE